VQHVLHAREIEEEIDALVILLHANFMQAPHARCAFAPFEQASRAPTNDRLHSIKLGATLAVNCSLATI